MDILCSANVGELEEKALKAIINSMAFELGLYKTQIIPDGNTVVGHDFRLPTGSGRTYARKALTNTINESAAAADKWYVSTNSLGRAEGQYGLTAGPQEFTFAAADVADGNTIYGAFAFAWAPPFDSGLAAGPYQGGRWDQRRDVSEATGVVTAVILLSGTGGRALLLAICISRPKPGHSWTMKLSVWLQCQWQRAIPGPLETPTRSWCLLRRSARGMPLTPPGRR